MSIPNMVLVSEILTVAHMKVAEGRLLPPLYYNSHIQDPYSQKGIIQLQLKSWAPVIGCGQ